MGQSDDTTGERGREVEGGDQRRPWQSAPDAKVAAGGWTSLDDDALLAWLQELPRHHGRDDELLDVVRSDRHFFVRQTAALRVGDPERLKVFATDRHVGQILVRHLSRAEDVDYLEALVRNSRHGDVRRSAEAQLTALKQRLAGTGAQRS